MTTDEVAALEGQLARLSGTGCVAARINLKTVVGLLEERKRMREALTAARNDLYEGGGGEDPRRGIANGSNRVTTGHLQLRCSTP